MTYCIKCGVSNDAEAKFCHSCGQPIPRPLANKKSNVACEIVETYKIFPHSSNPVDGWMKTKVGVCIKSDEKIWSETKVSSHGGGGYVHPQYGGNVSAAQVTSSVSTKREQKFWVRFDDEGTEEEFTITDCELAMKEGHTIVLVWCGLKNKTGPLYLATNLDTKQNLRLRTEEQIFSRANEKILNELNGDKEISNYYADFSKYPKNNSSIFGSVKNFILYTLISTILLFILFAISTAIPAFQKTNGFGPNDTFIIIFLVTCLVVYFVIPIFRSLSRNSKKIVATEKATKGIKDYIKINMQSALKKTLGELEKTLAYSLPKIEI